MNHLFTYLPTYLTRHMVVMQRYICSLHLSIEHKMSRYLSQSMKPT